MRSARPTSTFNPITGREINHANRQVVDLKIYNGQEQDITTKSKVSYGKTRFQPVSVLGQQVAEHINDNGVPPLDLHQLIESDDDHDANGRDDCDSPPYIEVKVKTPPSCFSMGTPAQIIKPAHNYTTTMHLSVGNNNKAATMKQKNKILQRPTSDDDVEKLLLEWKNEAYSKMELKKIMDKEELEEKNKELKLLDTVMTDQLCRSVVSDPNQQEWPTYTPRSIPMHIPGQPRGAVRLQHESKVRTANSQTECSLSFRVKFNVRMLTDEGIDAIRELTGFVFTIDGSLTIYEFKHFGKSSKAIPFIKRGVYGYTQGPRKGSRYSLTDIIEEGELQIPTRDQPLPGHLLKQEFIKLVVTAVDVDAKKKILLRKVEAHAREKVWNELHLPVNTKEETFLRIKHNVKKIASEQLKSKGTTIFLRLGNDYRKACHENGDTKDIDRFKLESVLLSYNINIPQSKFEDLMELLDPESTSFMSYYDFMRQFLGEMTENRKRLVTKAFVKIDHNRTGAVSLAEMCKFFNASRHPRVISGESSSDEVLDQFMSSLKNCLIRDIITFREFEEFYEGLSLLVNDDIEFTNILKNTWSI